MAAPTFVSQGASAFNTNTTPKTLSIAVNAGDTLVVYGLSDNDLTTISTPSDGVNTYLSIQSIVITDYCWTGAWKTTAATSTTLTVSCTRGGAGGDHWGIGWYLHRNSAGVGASSKTNVSGGAPSLALTTGSANSAIINVVGDWNAIDGTSSRVWRTINSIVPSSGAGTEGLFLFDSTLATLYSARWTDAGAAGSKTTGLSAPAGQKYSIIAIEILPSGATDVTVTDPAVGAGITLGQSPTSTTIDQLTSDAPSGLRLGESPLAAVAVGVIATTTPAGVRLGESPLTGVSIGVTVADTPSGIRLGTSPTGVTSGVVVLDAPSGLRLGASPVVGVTVDSGVADTPGGIRLGQSPVTVIVDVVIADSPSGLRLGQSGVVVGTQVFAADVPNGIRLGFSPSTVVYDTVATDAPSGLRLGSSPITVLSNVIVADAPSGTRLGESPVTTTAVVGVGDAPSGVRLGQSPVGVAYDVRISDVPSGLRLGLSPVTVNTGGISNITVADTPSGMRLGQSPVSVNVSFPVLLEPTIFAEVGAVTIAARSRPFVFDASVGVNIHAIVDTVVVEAAPDG